AARDEGEQAQGEAYEKRHQEEVREGHIRFFPLRPFPFEEDGGFKTSINRSASPGFSRMWPSRTRHMRESLWRAMVRSAWWTSGSREKRSAPATSQRSSLCS